MKTPKYSNKKLYILVLYFISQSIFGQLNFSLSTLQEYSDNPFRYPVPISTFISSFDLGMEYIVNDLGFGYYGDYSIFHEISDRNFYWHQFGFWNSNENFIYGLFLEQRINNSAYEFYNLTNYNGYAKYKLPINDLNSNINASLSLTNYSYLNDLDNLLGSAGIDFNKSFESKTTIMGGVSYNYKNYFETDLNDPSIIGDSLEQSFSSSAFTSQFNFYGRIAQSLLENTGLAVQYSQQNIVGGTAKYVRQLDYVYGDESQYFDDPISYESKSISGQLTQLIGENIILKGIFSYTKKEYPSQGIYLNEESFDSNILRNDELTTINFSLSKRFELENSYILLSLSYINTNNISNSYWYKYKNNQFNIHFDYQF